MFPGYTGKDLTVGRGVSLGERDCCGPAGSTSHISGGHTRQEESTSLGTWGNYKTCFAVLVGESRNEAQWLLLGPVFLRGSTKVGKTKEN